MKTSQQWREWLGSLGGTPVVYREDVEELIGDLELARHQTRVLQGLVEGCLDRGHRQTAVIEGIKQQLGRL